MSEVEITLNGQTETLRVSLDCAKRISAHFGNFVEAFNQVQRFTFAAYAPVVAAGLGKKPAEVEAAVFETGMDNLQRPLLRFLRLCSNGGREPVTLSPAVQEKAFEDAKAFVDKIAGARAADPVAMLAVADIVDTMRGFYANEAAPDEQGNAKAG